MRRHWSALVLLGASLAATGCGNDATSTDESLIADGREVFRSDTFGDEYLGNPDGYWKWFGAFKDAHDRLREIGKPTLARINGIAVGGGNELQMACDLAVMVEGAFIRHVGLEHGSVPAGGATQWLPIIVGDRRARRSLHVRGAPGRAGREGDSSRAVRRASSRESGRGRRELEDEAPKTTAAKQQINFCGAPRLDMGRSGTLATGCQISMLTDEGGRSAGLYGKEMSELVLVERDGPIAVVLLNRPEALNALSDGLMDELVTRLTELDKEEGVRCIVLGGSERAFAAGADIAGLAKSSPIDLYYQRRVERWDVIAGLWTPLVAAVSGLCLGGAASWLCPAT